jgi:hypothetical protein
MSSHMPDVSHMDRRFGPQNRRYRRFDLRYPVNVTFNTGDSVTELRAVSNNISLGGVLFETDATIPRYCEVSFVMTVREHPVIGHAQIVGEGKVVRVEPRASGTGFVVAVECKTPISQLRGDFLNSAS